MADPSLMLVACCAEEMSDGIGELSQNSVVLTRALAAYLGRPDLLKRHGSLQESRRLFLGGLVSESKQKA